MNREILSREVLPFLLLFFFESPGQRKTAWEKRNPLSGELL
jgi:hypothetical protein